MRVLGGMMIGSLAGRHAARRQFEAMQDFSSSTGTNKPGTDSSCTSSTNGKSSQTQQASNPSKKNMVEELEKFTNLKQQGILTEEEFQQFKTKLLSDI